MRHIVVIGLFILVNTNAHEAFLQKSFNVCVEKNALLPCLKKNVLTYIDDKLKINEERSMDNVDEALVLRLIKYLQRFDYAIRLPVLNAYVKYKPYRSFDDFDVLFESTEFTSGSVRGILKKKLLLPVLLLLKLKLKALMPIFVALIGIKAIKALILSKLALLIVVGFVALQIFKKSGMMIPAGMTMEPASGAYGTPSFQPTTSGYEPINTWDGNGPYARVWTPSNVADSQNLAYNYYAGSNSGLYSSQSMASSSMSSNGIAPSSTKY